jgi:hypothetical protein
MAASTASEAALRASLAALRASIGVCEASLLRLQGFFADPITSVTHGDIPKPSGVLS